jgi:hypothetical protein
MRDPPNNAFIQLTHLISGHKASVVEIAMPVAMVRLETLFHLFDGVNEALFT